MKNEKIQFVWRITALHTIAYFIAGIIALIFMNYKEHFASDVMAVFMRPVDSVWVALGSGLQLIRGILIGLVLLPVMNILVSEKGWVKLFLLVFGLSYISTIGPTFGSFEGYVYTTLPIQYHLLGLPETLIYTFLFSYLFGLWYKKPTKTWNILTLIGIIMILLMSVLGALSSAGILKS